MADDQIFAKLMDGQLVLDPVGIDVGMGTPDLQDLAWWIARGVNQTQFLPDEHRTKSPRLADVLTKHHDVDTDAETLIALPFGFVPDGELRQLLDRHHL